MTTHELIYVIDGRLLTKEDNIKDVELSSAFASDMMSHVLAFANNKAVLITALYNAQSLRTADLLGISCLILIGQNDPDKDFIELANDLEITLIQSPYSTFVTCGMLYSAGFTGIKKS
ncbi:MAG: hypothetical protein HUJ78_05310 [Mogibacterium sp.]|nr:hypothetical protein [Mogibacterium sp.]